MTVEIRFYDTRALNLKRDVSLSYNYSVEITKWFMHKEQVAEFVDREIIRGQGNLRDWQIERARGRPYRIIEKDENYDPLLLKLINIKKTNPDVLNEFVAEEIMPDICGDCADRRRD